MSSPTADRVPLIHLVNRAHRAFQAHMLTAAHSRGRSELTPAHNALFATLGRDGDRATALAARAGITRQSMGEVIRDLVGLGLLEMVPDPDDRRAKLVRYTARGLRVAQEGGRHLDELERLFVEEFGREEYDTAREVLQRLVPLLEDLDRAAPTDR